MSDEQQVEAVEVEEQRSFEQRTDDWQSAARSVAIGCELSDWQINQLCRAANRTVDDFQALVYQLRHRHFLRSQQSQLEDISAQVDQVKREIAVENQRFEQAVKDHRDKIKALSEERQRLVQEKAQVRMVPRELAQTCPDATLRNTLANANRACDTARHAADAARRNLSRYSNLSKEQNAEYAAAKRRAEEELARCEAAEAAALDAATNAYKACIDY